MPAEPPKNPLIRVLLAALIVGLVVVISVLLTSLTQRPQPAEEAAPEGTPEPTAFLVTPSPIPPATPTPAIYAPFGAQDGYADDSLLPETPTPAPDAPTPAPATPTPQPTEAPVRVLRKGDSGEDVKKLQEALIQLGYLSDKADGLFGGNTCDAVTAFQAVNLLDADGLAGRQTQALLFSGNALSADKAPPMDFLVLVNRENKAGKQFVPSDLVEIADVLPSDLVKVKYKGTKANRTAVEALGKMLEAAAADGLHDFQISSAYRTYGEQQQLVDNKVADCRKKNPGWSRDKCLSSAYNTVAPAGASEHQTGLAFDITVPGVSFTGTKQQKWLHKHCTEYGFVVRFTEDKQKKTGFIAESWHFRYVGVEAAAVMKRSNWCLEEYIEHMGL